MDLQRKRVDLNHSHGSLSKKAIDSMDDCQKEKQKKKE
jgi:hypothetical protein